MEKITEHYHIVVVADKIYEELSIQEVNGKWEVYDLWGDLGPEDQVLATFDDKIGAAKDALKRLLTKFPGTKPVYGAGALDSATIDKLYKEIKAEQK